MLAAELTVIIGLEFVVDDGLRHRIDALFRMVVETVLVPQVHRQSRNRAAMTVPDDENAAVVVVICALSRSLHRMRQFVLDQLLQPDRRRPPLVVAVEAGPVVLRVIQLIESDAVLAQVRRQLIDEVACLGLRNLEFVGGFRVPVVPIGLVGKCAVDREDLDPSRAGRAFGLGCRDALAGNLNSVRRGWRRDRRFHGSLCRCLTTALQVFRHDRPRRQPTNTLE